MATHTAAPAGSPASTEVEPFFERVAAWARAHRQITSWIGIAVVVGIVLFVWTASSNRRSEEVAGRELQGARFAFENQNMPLAASELARIMRQVIGHPEQITELNAKILATRETLIKPMDRHGDEIDAVYREILSGRALATRAR